MSDAVTIDCAVEMANEDILIRVLEGIFDHVPKLEWDTVAVNKWGHKNKLSIVIRENQLPDYLKGYGDIGFDLKDGKFVPVGISEQDSHYIDSNKGLENGTFAAQMNGMWGEVQNSYMAETVTAGLRAKFPGIKVERPSRVSGKDPNAMGCRIKCDSDTLARAGIKVPAFA